MTELWYDSLDDALNMGTDPAHRKYNISDEPLFVDMDGLKFTFFEEDIIRSRPAVDDPDDAALQWRSEARRVGKECVSPGRSRWTAFHAKKKTLQVSITRYRRTNKQKN